MLDAEPLSFQRGELPEKMAKPAFTIKEGEWAVLDDNADTLVLLQLVKRSRRDLKEMSSSIEKKLQGEKLKAQLDNLKKQSGVWLDQGYFAPAPPTPGSSTQPQTSGPTNPVHKEKDEDKDRTKTLWYVALPILIVVACVLQPQARAQMTSTGIDCSQIAALHLLQQENMRAGRALIECGVVQGGRPSGSGDEVTRRHTLTAQHPGQQPHLHFRKQLHP